jgi:hypothetical protein
VEVFWLLHLFDDDNLAIGGSNYDALGVLTGKTTGRATEEVDQQQVYGGRGHGKEDK